MKNFPELPGLWNQFKDYIYQKSIDTLEKLDDKFHEAIVTITLENVQQNLIRRATTCIESNGEHFEHRI
jgi:DNA-binding GntR family transcriptional regulator